MFTSIKKCPMFNVASHLDARQISPPNSKEN